MNLVGDLQAHSDITAAVVKTFEQGFDQVLLYTTFDRDQGDGNLTLIAFQGESRQPDLSGLPASAINRFVRQEALAHIN